jgi:hypothetical protein
VPPIQKFEADQTDVGGEAAAGREAVDFRKEVVDDFGGWFFNGARDGLEKPSRAKFFVYLNLLLNMNFAPSRRYSSSHGWA